MKVDIGLDKGIEDALGLSGYKRELDRELSRAMSEIGQVVEDDARDYAPISPTKGQYKATLKSGKTKRNDFQPATLMRSITHKVKGSRTVQIFTNQTSREYAYFMHFGRYKLGPGSRAKASTGKKVGRLFISRAIEDNEGLILKKLEKAVLRVFGVR